MLAELRSRLQVQDETRKRAMRRVLASAGVAVLHVLFLFLLIESEWLPSPLAKAREQPPLLWVLLPQAAKTPKVVPLNPNKSKEGRPPATYTLPRFIAPPEENNAIDLGLALGRSLACGANSFEYLSPLQRAACRHQPWHFVYDRYGNIVLDAQVTPMPQEEKPRPSDIQAHERNTSPVCPANVDPNAPCQEILPP